MTPDFTIIAGLSGPTSSGKTTLAKLLLGIFNVPQSERTRDRSCSAFILHQDDFYAAEDAVPTITTNSEEHGVREFKNWEGVDGVDFQRFTHVLQEVKKQGYLPADFDSKQDENEFYKIDVNKSRLEAAEEHVQSWLSTMDFKGPFHLNICIVEGWLLYPDPLAKRQNEKTEGHLRDIRSSLDVKLFIRSTLSIVRSRRARRSGYVMKEGFWVDPPGYIEQVIWPVYVEEHSWLFNGLDVESSEFELQAVGGKTIPDNIWVAPGLGDSRVEEVLDWAVKRLTTEMCHLVRAKTLQSKPQVE